MPGILHHVATSDDTRRQNDRHAVGPVAAVLGLVLLYAWACTDLARRLTIPGPAELARRLGLLDLFAALGLPIDELFRDDGGVLSAIHVSYTRLHPQDTLVLLFCALLAGAFLSAYFLPVRFKRAALVLWTVAGLALLYRPDGAAGLLLGHAAVYLSLHPARGRRLGIAALAGGLAWATFVPADRGVLSAATAIALPVAAVLVYGWVWIPLLARPRLGPVLREIVVQSPLLTVIAFAAAEGVTGDMGFLALGVLLFFWQWARVIMYHLDWKDGHVPADVSFVRYLSVFVSPGAVPVWQWGIAIGQGYRYVEDNFLSEPKNRIVWSGVRLMLLAFAYVVLWDWVHHQAVRLFTFLGVDVHEGETLVLVEDFVAGERVSTASVLLTTFLDLVAWVLHWGGIFHFKVAVWRVCGYKFDAEVNRPWLATNLVTFWPRITYHYREFLVRAFYFPVFLGMFRRSATLRIVAATFAAAGVGNLVWGHVTERMYYGGAEWEGVVEELATWPYFLLLAGGISLTELYLLRRKNRRRAWTLGPRIVFDVACAWATLQFFTMIRIFRRPAEDGTVWDLWRLFLVGLGWPQ
jgi:hypothetical protein